MNMYHYFQGYVQNQLVTTILQIVITTWQPLSGVFARDNLVGCNAQVTGNLEPCIGHAENAASVVKEKRNHLKIKFLFQLVLDQQATRQRCPVAQHSLLTFLHTNGETGSWCVLYSYTSHYTEC